MKYIFLFIITILTFSCGANKGNDNGSLGGVKNEDNLLDEKDGLKKLSIQTTNYDSKETNLSNYVYLFSISSDGQGFHHRVATFTSLEEFEKDIRDGVKKMKNITGEEYIVKILKEELNGKVNFSTENLVIVYLTTGGPPFGTMQIKEKGNEFIFCMKEPDVPIRGMALKTIFEVYAVPKKYTAVSCK